MKVKEILFEGTWAAPFTTRGAQELAELMQNPIAAKDAGHVLYHIVGDDQLFDFFDEIKDESPDSDVRHAVQNRLKQWLTKDHNWNGTWSPASIRICSRLAGVSPEQLSPEMKAMLSGQHVRS